MRRLSNIKSAKDHGDYVHVEMVKCLGQVMYEALRSALPADLASDFMPWEKLPEEVRYACGVAGREAVKAFDEAVDAAVAAAQGVADAEPISPRSMN